MQSLKLSPTAVLIVSCLLAVLGYSQDSLVLVNVTVTDPLNRYVNGLQKNHFRLYENGAVRPITYFEQRSVPVTMAIVGEVTEGPAGIYNHSRSAIRRYLESANPQDEFILVAFDSKSAMIEKTSGKKSVVEDILLLGQNKGLSYLEEAIHAGLNRIKNKTGKKALVLVSTVKTDIISQAWDTMDGIWALSGHPEFQTYTIQNLIWPQDDAGKKRDEPQRRTYVSSIDDTGYYLDLVYDELRNQYVLGFPAAVSRPARKRQEISVEIDRPKGLPKLKAKTGKGYYSPQP